jgi:hypothetical protein
MLRGGTLASAKHPRKHEIALRGDPLLHTPRAVSLRLPLTHPLGYRSPLATPPHARASPHPRASFPNVTPSPSPCPLPAPPAPSPLPPSHAQRALTFFLA